MNQLLNIQEIFFKKIKEKLPSNVSFVHEVSELLEISYDSTYRRIRGEKTISLEELFKLSNHFGVSVDSLFNVKSGNVVFESRAIDPDTFSIKDWLKKIHSDINVILSAKEKTIIYAAKDPPVFHYFQLPEIAAFKMFFWKKTLFQFPEYQEKKFALEEYDQEIQRIGQQVLITSTKIPTIEIWNEDTFNIILRQIEYYWVSGLFKHHDDIWILCDKLEKWIRHIQLQAEHGFKFLYGQEPHGIENSFQLYENEVVLNDNTIFVRMDGNIFTYITWNVVSLLITTDPCFGDKIEHYLRGLIKKSILISSSAAKERSRFFNRLINQINLLKGKIERSVP